MAAMDTFQWYVTTMVTDPGAETREYINEQRVYLHSLRSEDERQRHVESVIEELRLGARAEKKKS